MPAQPNSDLISIASTATANLALRPSIRRTVGDDSISQPRTGGYLQSTAPPPPRLRGTAQEYAGAHADRAHISGTERTPTYPIFPSGGVAGVPTRPADSYGDLKSKRWVRYLMPVMVEVDCDGREITRVVALHDEVHTAAMTRATS